MAHSNCRKLAGKTITKWLTPILIGVALFTFSTTAWSQDRAIGGKRDIDVMTVNLYIGSDLGALTNLSPADPAFVTKLLTAVATIHGRILASNFSKRADALAAQIVARGPDLVALQEVSLIRRQSPGDAILGGAIPATTVEVDFLAILLEALRRHGGHYAAVSQVQDTDVELPLVTGPATTDDVRLTDRDVILVRTDLPPGQLSVSNPQGANFTAAIPLPIGLKVLRGWCSIDVQLRGRALRVINTHLEDALPAPLPNFQGAQAIELLLGPANTTLPIVLAGDFNSDANGNYSSSTYALLLSQGRLTDAWSAVHPLDPGLTWGHDEALADPAVRFVFRLDLVLYRGESLAAANAEVADPFIGTPPPLWFSDHASVAARILIN